MLMRGATGRGMFLGGRWKLDISIPDTYPLHPPTIKFKTRVCHPNIHFKVNPPLSPSLNKPLLPPPPPLSHLLFHFHLKKKNLHQQQLISPKKKKKSGEICLDLLKAAWTPAFGIATTLAEIHRLLSYPVVDSPLNVDVAVLLREGDNIGAEGLVRWCCQEWRWDG